MLESKCSFLQMTQTKCLVITNYYYYLKVLILYLAVLLSVRLWLGLRETTIFVDPGSGVSLVTLLNEVGQVDGHSSRDW